MPNEKEYVRGLRDVAACQTRNSFVDPLGALYYAGYDIDRLLGSNYSCSDLSIA